MSENLINQWIDFNKNNYQSNISNSKKLKKNSEKLVKILEQFNVLHSIHSVFEMGCGCARNLLYLYRKNPNLILYGNDLIRESCFQYIDESIRNKIIFIEKDSVSLSSLENYSVDLFLAIDHLMHLDYKDVQNILGNIVDKWKPSFILIRDATVGRTEKLPIKFVHDYSIVDKFYTVLYNDIEDGFFIKLWEKNKNEN